jgi:hypothetical protein
MLQALANEEIVNVALEVRSVSKGNGLGGYRGSCILKLRRSEPSQGPEGPSIKRGRCE